MAEGSPFHEISHEGVGRYSLSLSLPKLHSFFISPAFFVFPFLNISNERDLFLVYMEHRETGKGTPFWEVKAGQMGSRVVLDPISLNNSRFS